MMKRSTIYIVIAVAIAAIAGALLWRPWASGQEAQTGRSAVVERGSMLVAVTASGRIEPEARVNLTFDTPGRVAEVLVEEGDTVEGGDVLAQLDTRQLETQVAQSRASLEQAESQLAELKSQPRPREVEKAEANVRDAQARVSSAAASRDQIKRGPTQAEIAAAEARVAEAEKQRKLAQRAYDEIDESNEEQKEHANYDLYTAKQQLAAAEANLQDVLDGADEEEVRAAEADVWAAAAQRDAAQAQLDLLLAGATEEEIAEAEAQVAQARAALELAELSLENATLRAPFDGVVSRVNVTIGETPPAQGPALVVLDNSQFHMTVSVDEVDVAQLALGQTAEVTLDALPGAVITGTVKQIAPIATLEGGVVTYDVTIDLLPTDEPIRADMSAEATIEVEELEDVLMIPTWVVRIDRDTGQTYVHRRIDGDVERVDVTLGVRDRGFAQVLEGLSEGDELVRLEEENGFDFGPR
jgi:HlyD family secretion protein